MAEVHILARDMVWCVMRHDTLQERYFSAAREIPRRRRLVPRLAPRSNKRVSMPFDPSPRTRPARYVALLKIKTAIAMLFNNFDSGEIGTGRAAEPMERLSFTLAPGSLRIRMRLRLLA